MNHQLTALALLCTVLVGSVFPYPTNVPQAVCESMIPGHGGTAQDSVSPYKVEVSPQIVHQGDVVQVYLSGLQPFRGFYVQGRTEDGTPIGTFIRSDIVKTHDCAGGKGNAAFHGVRGLKNNLEIFWKAPKDFEGQVLFTATFVSEFDTFWTFVKGNPIFVKILQRRLSSSPFFAKLEELAKNESFTTGPRIMNRKPKVEITNNGKDKFKFQSSASAFPTKNVNIPYQIGNSQSYVDYNAYLSSPDEFAIGNPNIRPNTLSLPPPVSTKFKTHNVNFHFTQPELPPLLSMQINPKNNNIYGPNYHPRHEDKINYHHKQFPYQFEYNGKSHQSHHPQQLTFSPNPMTFEGPIKTIGFGGGGSIPTSPIGHIPTGKRKTVWIMDDRFQNFKDVDDIIPNRLPFDSFQGKETSPYHPQHHEHNFFGGEVTLDTPNHPPFVNHAHQHHPLPPHSAVVNVDTHSPFLSGPPHLPIGGQGYAHHGSLHHFPTHGFLVRNLKGDGSSTHSHAEPPFYLIPANKHDVDNFHGRYFNYQSG